MNRLVAVLLSPWLTRGAFAALLGLAIWRGVDGEWLPMTTDLIFLTAIAGPTFFGVKITISRRAGSVPAPIAPEDMRESVCYGCGQPKDQGSHGMSEYGGCV